MGGCIGFGGSDVSGLITVYINGVATEVARGAIDMKTVFGEDVMLIHSSGVSVPTNEFGILMQSLQHGESYFLVIITFYYYILCLKCISILNYMSRKIINLNLLNSSLN